MCARLVTTFPQNSGGPQNWYNGQVCDAQDLPERTEDLSFWPRFTAVRPPIPASISSKMMVGVCSASIRIALMASITRDNFPEAIFAKGFNSSPTGHHKFQTFLTTQVGDLGIVGKTAPETVVTMDKSPSSCSICRSSSAAMRLRLLVSAAAASCHSSRTAQLSSSIPPARTVAF